MTAFYNNMTTTVQVSDALISLWEKSFLVSAMQDDVVSPFVDTRFINGKTDTIIKYSNLAPATTPLTETDDVNRSQLAETAIVVTPVEFGNAVTRTALSSLQSGGQIDLAAIELTGRNMGRTMNALATATLEGTSNVRYVGGIADGSITSSNIISTAEINIAYNALSRQNILPVEGGLYIAMAHDDVLYDLRNNASAGSWMDINKYTNVTPLANEVGSYGGFRWIRNNDCNYSDQSGAGTVDIYKVSFFGARALVNVVSQAPGLRLTGPFDALSRFVNIGWYGVFKHSLLDTQAVFQLRCASSVGNNAA